MAKINYGFEKRQRELAKQKKQDAKDARKREARAAKTSTDATPEPAAVTAPESAVNGNAGEPSPRVHLRSSSTS